MVAPGYGVSSGFCGGPGTPGNAGFCSQGGSPEIIDGLSPFNGGRSPIGIRCHLEFLPGGL
jgi:hypothetical protein